MAQTNDPRPRIHYVSEARLQILANTEPPGDAVYYEGDLLVIRRRDGTLEYYDERKTRASTER